MKRIIITACTAILLISFSGKAQCEEHNTQGEAGKAQCIKDSLAFAQAERTVLKSPYGHTEVVTMQVEMFNSTQCISYVKFPVKKFRTTVIDVSGQENPVTSQVGEENDALVAINGSYFNMKTLKPSTFTYIDGVEYRRTVKGETFRTNGVLAIKKNGRKLDIFTCDTTDYDALKKKYGTMLAAGPVLIEDGKTIVYDDRSKYADKSKFYTGRHPRSIIGLTEDGYAILVVIDGRFKGQGEGTTIAETAFISRLLGMKDALNLDGGGSSTLWTELTGVINHPYDNKVFDHAGERKVSNCILIHPR